MVGEVMATLDGIIRGEKDQSFCFSMHRRGRWVLETRFEVLVRADLFPMGFVKFRVLAGEGARLAVVDYLCRNPNLPPDPNKRRSVGEALLLRVLEGEPRPWRVILCTARPKGRKSVFTQSKEEHEKAEAFYRKHGFKRADANCALFRLLRRLMGLSGPAEAGWDLAELGGLCREHLEDSLPLGRDRASVNWFARSGAGAVAAGMGAGAWEEALAAATEGTATRKRSAAATRECAAVAAPRHSAAATRSVRPRRGGGSDGGVRKWAYAGAKAEVKFEGEWWEAEIMAVVGGRVVVHYVKGRRSEDEAIELGSERLRTPQT
jgi:hypothetical protein